MIATVIYCFRINPQNIVDIDYNTECKYQPSQCKKTAVKNWKVERAGGRRPKEREGINILTSQESGKGGT